MSSVRCQKSAGLTEASAWSTATLVAEKAQQGAADNDGAGQPGDAGGEKPAIAAWLVGERTDCWRSASSSSIWMALPSASGQLAASNLVWCGRATIIPSQTAGNCPHALPKPARLAIPRPAALDNLTLAGAPYLTLAPAFVCHDCVPAADLSRICIPTIIKSTRNACADPSHNIHIPAQTSGAERTSSSQRGSTSPKSSHDD